MGVVLLIGIVSGICMLKWFHSVARRWQSEARSKTEGDVIRYICGDFLDPKKTRIEWGWQEPVEVGQTVSFNVLFFSNNGIPYAVSAASCITVDITMPSLPNVVSVIEFDSDDQHTKQTDHANEMKVSFTVNKSGMYEISVKQNGTQILNSPFKKVFIPGPLSPGHTLLARTSHAFLSVVTMTADKNHRLMIDARDKYDNKCCDRLGKNDFENRFDLRITEAADQAAFPAFTWEIKAGAKSQLALDILVYEQGCFKASLTYDGEEIQNGKFDILVLNSTESDEVQRFLEKRNLNEWFECRLLNDVGMEIAEDDQDIPLEGSVSRRSRLKSTGDMFVFPSVRTSVHRVKSHTGSSVKLRKVYCYITPKQLIIKEFFFKVFPKRMFTFRVSPTTKILCGDTSELCELPTLMINDGSQPKVVLACKRRNVLAATFVGILHSNMGQSDTFEAKVNYFNKQLLDYHKLEANPRTRPKVELCIDRNDFLASSLKETRNLSVSAWTRQFVVSFKNENGLDWGGVNREWIHLLCKALFDARSETDDGTAGGCGLFRKMKDDAQALVLPTPSSKSGFKDKYYEFAGKVVGKCVLESAIGGEYRRQVTARFSRSFLAQIIGLPVTYAYFESDDPDLFVTKVQYIAENDVTDMELTFTEEVYTSSGTLGKEIELIPHGANIAVTNSNKRKYLNRVAQFRLSESIKSEIEHFVKGLTSIVPDHLLSVFDENELELVMCGSSEISVDDMKLYSCSSSLPKNMHTWYWAVVSSFTQDDFARLLQFTTGCSQLPPDGFKELEPRFKISLADYNPGGLPTSHTCFNELCLPLYDSYEELHRMLKIAITEGATGFGLI